MALMICHALGIPFVLAGFYFDFCVKYMLKVVFTYVPIQVGIVNSYVDYVDSYVDGILDSSYNIVRFPTYCAKVLY